MARPPLQVGEPAPFFNSRTRANPKFVFDTVAGRYIVLSFFGSSADPAAAEFLDAVRGIGNRFDDRQISFFGVTTDPADENAARAADVIPGIRFFFDTDASASGKYGAAQADGYRPITYVLDPMLRVIAAIPLQNAARAHFQALVAALDRLPPIGEEFRARIQAPILVLPRVFEPELCRALVNYYEERGGEDSGFMRDINGRTMHIIEYRHKRRRDRNIADEALRQQCVERINRRLIPAIEAAFQFRATRIERHIVACYDAEEKGHFRAHRDNSTLGTAHRRFAVSLFLNTGEFEGGFLRFPEYGPALYQAPTGGAVVFSCTMLHEATTVTRGLRYMYLPFLYNESGKRIRNKNLRFVGAEAPAADDGADVGAGTEDTFSFRKR